MTDKLPPNLLALFAPRPALRFLPHSDHAPEERRTATIGGVAQYLDALKNYEDSYQPTESWLQKKDRKKLERAEKLERMLVEGSRDYKPSEDAQVRGDAFKTLFVARLHYDTDAKDLEREFGRFGPIERIRIVADTHATDAQKAKKKNRGYAFIVYEREKDMKAAYKETDGIRIRDRRVLVDVERGRTVTGWRPRRFGGGLGGRGYTKQLPARPSGPGIVAPPGPGFRNGLGSFRGGGRAGGFRGGFRGGCGSDRGSGFGSRAGIGYQANGYGHAPEGAPSGPRGVARGGGYGDRVGRYEDRRGPGPSGSNREPVAKREYRDRDREAGYGRDDYGSRKRHYENEAGYDDSRSKRRY